MNTRPPRRAYFFLAASILTMLMWPILAHSSYYTWFLLLGIVLISFSRFRGAQHGIPCPEVVFLVSAHWSQLFFQFLPSTRIPSVDELLLKFDANFGYAEALAGKLIAFHPAIGQVFEITYWGITLAGVLVYLALPNRAALRLKYIITNALVLLIFFFYRICPAAGPRQLIGNAFPNAIPNLVAPHAKIIPFITLNAVPSGHVTWALLLFWFARIYCGKRARIGATVFVLLTCIATIGKGEHYVIDLIVAVPFAAGVWALSDLKWRRAAVAFLVTGLWCEGLAQGWALALPRPAVWLLCAATLIPFLPDPASTFLSRLECKLRLPRRMKAVEEFSTN